MSDIIHALMIEDDEHYPELVRLAAFRGGMNVKFDVARTMTDGIRMIGEARYDAILCDLKLPDSPSDIALTVGRVAKASGPIPLIVLSGYIFSPHLIDQCIANGADDCYEKPADAHNLIVAIRALVARAQAERPYLDRVISALSEYRRCCAQSGRRAVANAG